MQGCTLLSANYMYLALHDHLHMQLQWRGQADRDNTPMKHKIQESKFNTDCSMGAGDNTQQTETVGPPLHLRYKILQIQLNIDLQQ